MDIDELAQRYESKIVDHLIRFEPLPFEFNYFEWVVKKYPAPDDVGSWEYDNPEPDNSVQIYNPPVAEIQ